MWIAETLPAACSAAVIWAMPSFAGSSRITFTPGLIPAMRVWLSWRRGSIKASSTGAAAGAAASTRADLVRASRMIEDRSTAGSVTVLASVATWLSALWSASTSTVAAAAASNMKRGSNAMMKEEIGRTGSEAVTGGGPPLPETSSAATTQRFLDIFHTRRNALFTITLLCMAQAFKVTIRSDYL